MVLQSTPPSLIAGWQKPLGLRTKGCINELGDRNVSGTRPLCLRETDGFLRDQAAEYRRRDQKVVVIISDALRYEVAEECQREIRKLPRYDAELKPMISTVSSYTQLDMVALLPNQALCLSSDSAVSSFGEPTQGTGLRNHACVWPIDRQPPAPSCGAAGQARLRLSPAT